MLGGGRPCADRCGAYGLMRRNVVIDSQNGWGAVELNNNHFVGASREDCLVAHDGGFANVAYSNNSYSCTASADAWFCADGERLSLDDWASQSGESGAEISNWTAPDPGRNLDTYAEYLSIGTTLADFAASARLQSRHRYRPELMADNANAYIREGYGTP